MKRFVSVILVCVCFCSVLCSCTEQAPTTTTSSLPYESRSAALEAARQLVINECCKKTGCKQVRIDYGLEELRSEEEDSWVFKMKGNFYPVDSYGKTSTTNYTYMIYAVVYKDGSKVYSEGTHIN